MSDDSRNSRRVALVDALRALALFGILQINIQSFVWGGTDPLGYFFETPRLLDSVAYLLAGTLIAAKFMSLFAFLFGFGFAMQMRQLRRKNSLAQAKAAYRRRLWFLLMVGLAHGLLLYYGDILSLYAICGFLLLGFAGARLRLLVGALWLLLIAHIALNLLLTATVFFAATDAELRAMGIDPQVLPEATQHAFTVFTQASFSEQICLRAGEYGSLLMATLTTSIPQILSLFLLGALAARLGWLTHPQRHPRVWRVAIALGLLSLPPAALGAWLNYSDTLHAPGNPWPLGYTLLTFSAPMAALYLALLIRLQHRPAVRALLHWLAPAGRMPLTNYLLQSLLMGLLLSGWGFGLGADLRKAELAVLALLIVLLQIAFSRWWIRHYKQGPVEALWRRATYR